MLKVVCWLVCSIATCKCIAAIIRSNGLGTRTRYHSNDAKMREKGKEADQTENANNLT